MFSLLAIRRPALTVFLVLVVFGLLWVVYTDHVWEDYYITFRASRNLATGNGLVFTEGERVHSFTSPLGVLLPALSSLMVANRSEDAALFIFRLFSIAAYAGAGVLLWRMCRAVYQSVFVAVVLVLLYGADCKTVDFTINGMETGILLLFISWTLWAVITAPRRQSLHLGLAWAGLLWTRPDAWVYIGGICSGAALFCPKGSDLSVRMGRLKTMSVAGAIAVVCYAPWVLWAWSYYASPIPHTIIAKGLDSSGSLTGVLRSMLAFPVQVASGRTWMAATFLPPYGLTAGWPTWLSGISGVIAHAAIAVWLLPFVRWEARVVSFGALAGQVYLCAIVKHPVPWYLPPVSALSLVALVLVFGQVLGVVERSCELGARGAIVAVRPTLLTIIGLWAVFTVGLNLMTAQQMRVQQQLIENGNRRCIGEWLRRNARSSHDTVFLEPLGYIGYFSGLKMLDYPGLGSPEVVAARRRAKVQGYLSSWPELIRDLRPDWLVMRPYEAAAVNRRDGELLAAFYERVRRFDVSADVDSVVFLPGRSYLINDSIFDIYRRRPLIAPAP